MKLKRLVLGIGGVLATAAPSCAVSAPTATGTYVACYKTSGGDLRFTNEADGCDPGEQQATWNQTGPAGPAGAPGVNGNGPVYYNESTGVFAPTNGYATVASLTLPAGSYQIAFTARSEARSASLGNYVYCTTPSTNAKGLVGTAESSRQYGLGTVAMNGTLHTNATETLAIRCTTFTLDGTSAQHYLIRSQLTATKVTQVIAP